jgi:cytochrome c2
MKTVHVENRHWIVALALLASLDACGAGESRHAEAKRLIASHCGACHIVPGVRSTVGRVGPSLDGIASRQFIAGRFVNNHATMVEWLMRPQAMAPGSAMPDMGLSRSQAMAIADYLGTLDVR